MEIWKLLQKSLDFTEQHLNGKLSVQQMAEQAYLSPFYYQRLFKRILGITPAAYVNQRRLSKALTYLTAGTEPISVIAASLGYESHETFSRAFKALFGVSPSEQRKKRYCLPRYGKPNLSAQYDFCGVNVPLSAGGIVFTLRLTDLEYLRHFLPKTSSGFLEPDRELAETTAPPGFCGQTMMIGRYAVCSVEAESPAALRPSLQTAKQYIYTRWAPENRVSLCYPGFELYHGLLPDGTAFAELWMKLKYWRGTTQMENETISCTQITLEDEVYVTGINLQASGLPITFESLGKMWDKKETYTEEIRNNTPSTVYPVVEYGIALNKIPDYIVGRQVSAHTALSEPYCQYTIPKGAYLKVAFHGDTFEDMVQNRLEEAMKTGKAWAKKNKIRLDGTFTLEVYPHETTMTDFPEMYLLFPIKQ